LAAFIPAVMRALPSLATALSAAGVALLSCTPGASAAKDYSRNSASPSYRGSDVCPERCLTSGQMASQSQIPCLNITSLYHRVSSLAQLIRIRRRSYRTREG
jgi:uncharacterized metal-binding protein